MLARTFAARTAAELAEQRMAFLADIGEILHSSLAVEETFDALLHLIVPSSRAAAWWRCSTRRGGAPRARHARRPGDGAVVERLARYPRQLTQYIARRAARGAHAELVWP
jgi:hypothetical protein